MIDASWLLVAIPALSATVLLLLGRRSDAWGPYLAIAASTASFVVGLLTLFTVLGQEAEDRIHDITLYSWLPAGDFSVDLGMRIDPLSLTFVMLITFVGTLIHIYSLGYMQHDADKRRFFAYLNLFVAAMLTLVLANSYAGLFLGWRVWAWPPTC